MLVRVDPSEVDARSVLPPHSHTARGEEMIRGGLDAIDVTFSGCTSEADGSTRPGSPAIYVTEEEGDTTSPQKRLTPDGAPSMPSTTGSPILATRRARTGQASWRSPSTGAAEVVAPPGFAQVYAAKPSAGSTAGGNVIAGQGEKEAAMRAKAGYLETMTFQIVGELLGLRELA